MNDRTDELERRLLRATAPQCPPDEAMDAEPMDAEPMDAEPMDAEPMDAETASLREGWLAFGQLLEEAQPMADASAIEELLPSPRTVSGKRSSLWKATVAAAMAASLVIGATLAWNLMSGRTDIAVEEAVEGTDDEVQPPGSVVDENAIVDNAVEENATDALQWDDSLDERLSLVSQAITQLDGDWDYYSDAYDPAWEGLDRIDQDIEEGTL